VNIALANEFALMCQRLEVSTKEVIEAAATKPFGFMPFYPGPGIGGHCIPVDPLYLAWKMRLNGYEARFIALADDINRAMPEHVVELVTEGLNGRRRAVNGARILALGVAYKPGAGAHAPQPGFTILASQSSTVTGVVRLTADVVDEPGLIGVYFRVDGYVQEGIQTETPYEIWWSAASATNGEHTITAKAHYASGEWIESAPLRLTVANPVAFNRTLYADAASGDDANDGLAPSTAWRNLDRDNQAVVPGDTVMLQGTFTGQRIAPNVSGTVGRPIKFTSYAGTTAVLD